MSKKNDKNPTMPAERERDKAEAETFFYSPDRGEAAYQQLLPRLRALPEYTPAHGVNVASAAVAALGVAARVREGELGAKLARIPAELFDAKNLALLEDAAWAAWHAQRVADGARASASEARLPAELVERAATLEQRMQACCEYYFADDPELGPEVARLRSGSGYKDLAADLLGYAAIYRARRETVAGDRKYFRPDDAEEAVATAEAMVVALGESLGPEAKTALEDLGRAWTFLSAVYREVVETARWVERSDAERMKRFPELVTAARGKATRRGGKKTEGGTPAAE